MSWDNVIGQDRIKEILSRTLQNNKIPSALLFVGNEGTGKEAVALEFAKLLNSPTINYTDGLANLDPEFEKRWSNNIFNHPNINYIFSLPTVKKTTSSKFDPIEGLSEAQLKEIKKQLELKTKNYYHQISIDKANLIKIDQVRKIKNSLKLSAPSNGRRVYIISNADRMNNEAFNAFLKTIEEPAPKTTIILTTSNLELILPTIRSRCQIIRFNPIKEELIVNYLINNGITKDNSRLIIPFAEGSISKALDFSGEDVVELRNLILSMLRLSLKKNYKPSELFETIESICSKKDSERLKKGLKLLSVWLRDAYRVANGFDKISNADQLDSISKFAKGFANKNFSAAINKIEECQLMIKQNVNPELVLSSLVMNFRKIFLY
ncbi:DNA polymerase III subunit delta' C-terminal domain-containing protein [Candidatus Kapabacteria bacterium]|nr:DNA polymerase III subunit delta' C-terminal domain-containing protein [Candidatus Kapabacteria bacterium]